MPKINWSPFSETGLESIHLTDAFINIYEGAVRSSKTVCSIISWIKFVEDSPHREFLMTGKTADTLFRNVLDGDVGMINIIGSARAKYKKSSEGGAKLQFKCKDPETGKMIVKTIYCLGANDERAEGNIRGMTIAGWYADEVTLYPESFVKQGINRMSLDGAQAFWTMNPDSPYHYIKIEFIDKAVEKGYKIFHFELDDNLSLSERYKNSLKAAYSGLWYKRMVLGLWVMADGVIYDLFNHEEDVVDTLPHMKKYWVGVDYGTSNATTFILCGLGQDECFYVCQEYYHSGKDGISKSPSQYSKDMKHWLEALHDADGTQIDPERIFIDPSAEGFILQCWQDGVKRTASADNAVKTGIELVSNLMGNRVFKVHSGCKNVLRELSSYCWDEKAQKRGEDVPLKTSDHTMDPIRYVINTTKNIWIRKAKK